MKEHYQRSYRAQQIRGTIKKTTCIAEFLDKIREEYVEACEAGIIECNEIDYVNELADIIDVCQNQIIHLGYDPEKIMHENLRKNEARAKKVLES